MPRYLPQVKFHCVHSYTHLIFRCSRQRHRNLRTRAWIRTAACSRSFCSRRSSRACRALSRNSALDDWAALNILASANKRQAREDLKQEPQNLCVRVQGRLLGLSPGGRAGGSGEGLTQAGVFCRRAWRSPVDKHGSRSLQTAASSGC